MIRFVVTYDRRTGASTIEPFYDADSSRAMERVMALTHEHRSELDHVEINLFRSESEDTFRMTHARYFGDFRAAIATFRNDLGGA